MKQKLEMVFYNLNNQHDPYITFTVNVNPELFDRSEVEEIMTCMIDSDMFVTNTFNNAGEGEVQKVRATLFTEDGGETKQEILLEI